MSVGEAAAVEHHGEGVAFERSRAEHIDLGEGAGFHAGPFAYASTGFTSTLPSTWLAHLPALVSR